MSRWKTQIVRLTFVLLGVSVSLFLGTGYTALYWAWMRGNLGAALPYLPWATTFGMVAIAGAATRSISATTEW